MLDGPIRIEIGGTGAVRYRCTKCAVLIDGPATIIDGRSYHPSFALCFNPVAIPTEDEYRRFREVETVLAQARAALKVTTDLAIIPAIRKLQRQLEALNGA